MEFGSVAHDLSHAWILGEVCGGAHDWTWLGILVIETDNVHQASHHQSLATNKSHGSLSVPWH